MLETIIHFTSIEAALNYMEWFRLRAAQYGVEVESEVLIGELNYFVILKSCNAGI